MRSIKSLFTNILCLAPAARTATATGAAIDLANYDSNVFNFEPGVLTDGVHTPKLTECATSGGTYTDVAAADQDGTLAALASNVPQAASYIGTLRFIKVVITTTGSPATGLVAGVYAMLGNARKRP